MREHGGAIVNITSISAVRAATLRSAYGTSKAGLAHLTKQLAVGPRGRTGGSGIFPLQRSGKLHQRADSRRRWWL
jgi:NAD(P)-dependent dehydrogenase (short-subunit alcohol dehydrogenase family)